MLGGVAETAAVTESEMAVTALGYAAAVVTIAAQRMRTMIPLRVAAIVANLLFIAFGALAMLWNVLFLHLILLPLNTRRLLEMRRLIARVRDAAEGDFAAEWLHPFTRRAVLPAGTILFRRGDHATTAYYLLSGVFRYHETGRVVEPGRFFGDLGIFAEDGRRTNTGICDTKVEALELSYEELTQLYLQNPRFGFYYVRKVVSGLREHITLLEAARDRQEQLSREG